MDETDPACPVCARPMIPGPSVTRHHLVPRLKGGKLAEPVHAVCHTKLHSVWDETQLRDHYATWEAIRSAPEMQSFIRWVRKKPADFVDTHRMVKGHKRRKRR